MSKLRLLVAIKDFYSSAALCYVANDKINVYDLFKTDISALTTFWLKIRGYHQQNLLFQPQPDVLQWETVQAWYLLVAFEKLQYFCSHMCDHTGFRQNSGTNSIWPAGGALVQKTFKINGKKV